MDQNADNTASENINAPQAPMPATAPAQTPPEAPKSQFSIPKDKKPLLFIGAIVAAAVVGLLIFTSMGKISKADYREAVLVYNDVSSDASDSFSSLTALAYASSSSTQTKIDNDVDDAKKALATYEESNKKLKDLKALKNKDVKAAYEEYENKYNDYVKYADSLVESLPQFANVIKSCDSNSSSMYSTSDVAAYLKAVTTCRSALKKAKDVSNDDFAKFAQGMDDVYGKLENIITEMSKLSTPNNFGTADYNRARELRNELYDIRIYSVYSDFSSNVTKSVKDADPAKAMNELGNQLRKKANE